MRMIVRRLDPTCTPACWVRRDLNPHALMSVRLSVLCVCQFHHEVSVTDCIIHDIGGKRWGRTTRDKVTWFTVRPATTYCISSHKLNGVDSETWTHTSYDTRPSNVPVCHFQHIDMNNILVPLTGLEPVRVLPHGILSPRCLPIPPHRHRKIGI